MLKEERQKLILDQLKSANKINFGELNSMFSVSYDSIRRDVIELEDKGLLKKVHGGVVSNGYLDILSGQQPNVLNGEDLEIIIKKALRLLKKNQVVIMDGGTTNFFLAKQIPKNLNLTIITNSPPLAMALNEHENIEVVLLGGRYYKRYQVTMGLEVSLGIQNFNADLYFMGINGVDAVNGLTIRNYEESILKRQMMKYATKVVCCVVEEKMGVIEAYQVCKTLEIQVLITSLNPDNAVFRDFKGVEIL